MLPSLVVAVASFQLSCFVGPPEVDAVHIIASLINVCVIQLLIPDVEPFGQKDILLHRDMLLGTQTSGCAVLSSILPCKFAFYITFMLSTAMWTSSIHCLDCVSLLRRWQA